MIRLAFLLCLSAAVGAALFLFHIKVEVRQLERDLAGVHQAIGDHREAIRVLRSEWSYLNQPARIAELARRHLGLEPIPSARVIRLEDLQARAQLGAAQPAGGPQ